MGSRSIDLAPEVLSMLDLLRLKKVLRNIVVCRCMNDQNIKSIIIESFHRQFERRYNTVLLDEGDEPIYRPACESYPKHRIYFAHGFWNSALHEIAHWCIAGPQRRLETDYGYWYQPDGRSPELQAEFERFEVKPQALEWLFTSTTSRDFYLSIDNLSGDGGADLGSFKKKVQQQALSYVREGLPLRAGLFWQELQNSFGTSQYTRSYWLDVQELDILPS